MNNSIRAMMETYCTEQFRSMMPEVEQIVENFELEGLEDALDQIAVSTEMYETTSISDMIYQRVYDYLSYLIRNHEIQLAEDIKIPEMVVVANAIYLMQNWIDHSCVIRITESDASAEEKFADLIALVDTVSSTKAFTLIESVPETFIQALQQLHLKKAEEQEEAEGPGRAIVLELRALRKYLAEIQGTESNKVIAFNIIAQGVQIGGDFKFYLNEFFHQLDTTEDARYLAIQYFALLYLGADSSKNILIYWREHNAEMIDDLSLINKVDIALNSIYVDYGKWRATMSKTLELL